MSAAERFELLPRNKDASLHGSIHGSGARRCRSGACMKELSENERELKMNMYYHISNPISRWKTDRKFPVKLVLQILKTFCVVTQAVLLLDSSTGLKLDIFSAVDERFSRLLIKDFSPSANMYYVYTTDELLQELEYSGSRFYNLTSLISGAYDFVWNGSSIQPITVILTQHAQAQFNSEDNTFVFNGTQTTVMFTLEQPDSERAIVDQFLNSAQDDRFQRFVKMDVVFVVRSVQVIQPSQIESYLFTFIMHFEAIRGGIIEYSLTLEPSDQPMNGTMENDLNAFIIFFDLFILLACGVSFISALSTVYTAFKLAKAMGNFYQSKLDICLPWKERMPLFKVYYIYNIASDISTITGTIIKIVLEIRSDDSPTSLTAITIFLGMGILLQATVLMGYLSYFRQFNTLTRTLNIASFRLVKFIICASILFLAFMMVGWLVLSPYHRKFSSFYTAFYTLFTMMNGDDLYTTYTGMHFGDNKAVYIFSQVFFTIFLILFIYAVLNLFISLIIESHEASQKQDSATRNEVRRFIFSGALTSNGVALKNIISVNKYVDPSIVKRRGCDQQDVRL